MIPSKQEEEKKVAIKPQASICPTLSAKEVNYIQAKSGTPIKAFVNEKRQKDLVKEIIKLITNAAIDTGQLKTINEKIYLEEAKKDVSVLEITAKRFTENLITDFPAITIEEITLAFKGGARGQFGEFMGLNLKTFTHWIKSYFESDEVKKACRIQLDYTESLRSQQQVLDELRSEELNKQAAQEMIREFRENHNNISGLQLFIFKQWSESYHDKNIQNFPHDLDLENEALENVLKEKSNKSAFNRTESEKNKNDFYKVKAELFENKEVQTEYKFLRVKKWILS